MNEQLLKTSVAHADVLSPRKNSEKTYRGLHPPPSPPLYVRGLTYVWRDTTTLKSYIVLGPCFQNPDRFSDLK